ncbi:MAG: DNA repair protein RecN [Oscillospiraceae bacterium]|nr:DNA repair protein RecN [Oscillospiraceae bacterium]
MLKRLFIENVAIIEKVDIEFMNGLCVLSGETGAGKSIIIDSINALTGGRVSREMIRTGANSAVVSAVFEDISQEAKAAAEQMGFDPSDGLLLKREMYLSGHNSCHINGQPATLAMLRQLGTVLINIHGQHDGLYLLDENLHIDYLDEYADIQSLLDEYLREYEKLLSQNRQIKALSLSVSEKQKRLIEIEKQISALEEVEPKANEYSELTQLRSRLYAEEKQGRAISEALMCLAGTDEEAGACTNVSKAGGVLAQLKTASGSEICSVLTDAYALLDDAASRLTDMMSKLEYSPELLDQTEERLDKLEKLASKCSCQPDELDKMLKSLYDEQGSLLMIDKSIDGLKADYMAQRTVVTHLAEEIHNKRENAANELSVKIEESLAFLSMPNARFCVEISPISEQKTKFTKKGTDTVRFLLSANRGEDPKPLSKVASGGELSRIMLSFKNVLGKSDRATAIFDEIDTGVSGKAASRVAHMLKAIACDRQVLCVTHLPQIACAAAHQYRISKSTVGTRTQTSVEKLDRAGRIEDLCRLIGGEHITDATIVSAEQMLSQAENSFTNNSEV